MTDLLWEPLANLDHVDVVRRVNGLLTRFARFGQNTSVLIENEVAINDNARADSWFWTAEWQAGEHAVDDHVARGELSVFDDIDTFFAQLGDTASSE